MALWSGRFEEATNEYALKWGASLETDKVMAEHDIAGSIAHARMLSEQGIISEQDFDDIEAGLGRIRRQIEEGTFAWDERDEDVHMAIERALTADIGAAGARLHTGRSRNDQVATDIRLLAKELADDLLSENNSLREVLLDAAEKYVDVVMPGYTHLQHAQPVLLSHHLLAYFWMLTRDHDRLGFAFDAADANPLGSAALAGTSYPLDRDRTTELLDFATTMPNSLDAVSDRDYLLDLVYACAVSMMHLSRLA
ncbi:MAG: argininosuccinate lyase, partial [Atopobiaceae bacterium]|nr:argininosuccinate lyase [Atopobiaceae bacterium]